MIWNNRYKARVPHIWFMNYYKSLVLKSRSNMVNIRDEKKIVVGGGKKSKTICILAF